MFQRVARQDGQRPAGRPCGELHVVGPAELELLEAHPLFAAFIGVFSQWPPYHPLAPDQALVKLSFSRVGKPVGDCRKPSEAELAARHEGLVLHRALAEQALAQAAKLPEKLQQAGSKKYNPTPDEWASFPRYNNLVEAYSVKKCEPALQQAKATRAMVHENTILKVGRIGQRTP